MSFLFGGYFMNKNKSVAAYTKIWLNRNKNMWFDHLYEESDTGEKLYLICWGRKYYGFEQLRWFLFRPSKGVTIPFKVRKGISRINNQREKKYYKSLRSKKKTSTDDV